MVPMKLKWGIVIDKEFDDSWRFGIMLSHWGKETYLTISLFKRSIRIRKLYQDFIEENPVIGKMEGDDE